jgi:hypothetical protein
VPDAGFINRDDETPSEGAALGGGHGGAAFLVMRHGVAEFVRCRRRVCFLTIARTEAQSVGDYVGRERGLLGNLAWGEWVRIVEVAG